jgi:[acyl-carrier-protein] S-malonyltransferase
MMKTAFIFPGQGAQYVGMGKDFYDHYPEAVRVFELASQSVGYDMKKMCFEGPADVLEMTENTQPAILTASIAALSVLETTGLKADVVAGLSLGEYSALVAAGSIKIEDAVPLVKARGKFMQEAVPVGVGKMAAIIGLSRDQIYELCEVSRSAGIVEPANFNSPGQVVIAGETAAIERAVELAKEFGAKKAIILPVSAPFHCSMLKPAGLRLAETLKEIEISDPNIPIIANINAKYIQNPAEIKQALERQVSHSIYWEDTIEQMAADGVSRFIEVGPGKVLSGFVKRIVKDAVIHNIEDRSTLEKLLDY